MRPAAWMVTYQWYRRRTQGWIPGRCVEPTRQLLREAVAELRMWPTEYRNFSQPIPLYPKEAKK